VREERKRRWDGRERDKGDGRRVEEKEWICPPNFATRKNVTFQEDNSVSQPIV
jgi:hypothetical protein